MKIKKPEDEKYFKDIVLKDILEEISNEDGISRDNTAKLKKTKSSQKTRTKPLLYAVILAIFIILLVLFFSLVNDASKTEIPTIEVLKVIPQSEDEEAWKMNKDRESYMGKTSPHKNKVIQAFKEKKKKEKKKIQPIEIKTTPPKPQVKTERELAKEALRQQMIN